jgi:ribosomal protein S18 acetylase RimI-like enzyme
MVSKGKLYNLLEHEGFIAEGEESKILGILMYRLGDGECEILSLDSLKEGIGLGTNLLNELKKKCKTEGIKRIWLITTNDNTNAMKFYQKRGFDLVSVFRNSMLEARKLKPSIPLFGIDEIEIKHEVEFEIRMEV